MVEPQQKTVHYIVEHFEQEFSDWTLSEYVHMILTLRKLYQRSKNHISNQLILTNFKYVSKLNDGTLKEDDCNTLKNTKLFVQIS